MEIKLLNEADIPAAMRLKELAGWNQTEADWRRLLRLEPRGCFAAWLEGRLVATTTTTTYMKDLAWIGMVLVDPEYRRRGIATELMREALAYLRGESVEVVKLDATPAGRPVYEALGFVCEGLIERWEAVEPRPQRDRPSRRFVAPGPGFVAWNTPQILVLDRSAFGADRSRLVESLLADSCVPPLALAAPDGALRGYALARPGTAAYYVGPLVALDEHAAEALLDAMLVRLAGERVYVDFHSGFAKGGHGGPPVPERGFCKQRDLIRMRLGRESAASTLVFAIAGPEVG